MNRTFAGAALLSLFALTACSDGPMAPADFEPVDAAFVNAPALGSGATAAAAAARPGASTIVQLAGSVDALSTLVFAIGVSDTECGTNFGSVLGSGGGQFTVFAPTNDAFSALIGALGAETVLSCDVLPTVLAFHVTRGRLNSLAVLARPSIRMLSGESASVVGTTIAGAPLNLGLVDISASNGIVHVVDAVLIPGSILAAL